MFGPLERTYTHIHTCSIYAQWIASNSLQCRLRVWQFITARESKPLNAYTFKKDAAKLQHKKVHTREKSEEGQKKKWKRKKGERVKCFRICFHIQFVIYPHLPCKTNTYLCMCVCLQQLFGVNIHCTALLVSDACVSRCRTHTYAHTSKCKWAHLTHTWYLAPLLVLAAALRCICCMKDGNQLLPLNHR